MQMRGRAVRGRGVQTDRRQVACGRQMQMHVVLRAAAVQMHAALRAVTIIPGNDEQTQTLAFA